MRVSLPNLRITARRVEHARSSGHGESEEARTRRVSLPNLQVAMSEERFTPKAEQFTPKADGSQPVGHRMGFTSRP